MTSSTALRSLRRREAEERDGKHQEPSLLAYFATGKHMDACTFPSEAPRGVTDRMCCGIFLFLFAGFIGVYVWALVHGKRHFLGFPDKEGQLCGIHHGVEDKQYLFFCHNTDGTESLTKGICVSQCPVVVGDTCADVVGGGSDYASRPLMDMLCAPDNDPAVERLTEEVLGGNPVLTIWMNIIWVLESWHPLMVCAILACILSFIYIYFLESCIFCIFWGNLVFTALASLLFGSYMIWQTEFKPEDFDTTYSTLSDFLPEITYENSTIDLAAGIVAVIISFLCVCFAIGFGGRMNDALQTLRQVADCMNDDPSLLLLPFITIMLKCATFLVLGAGFYYLVSTCQLRAPILPLSSLDTSVNLNILWSFSWYEYAMMIFYLLMSCWIAEFLRAVSQFVTSFAFAQWYFETDGGAKSDGCCKTRALSGLGIAWYYHIGTFAMGSACIAPVRLLRVILRPFAEATLTDGNAAGRCAQCCCASCINFYTRMLRYLTSQAYMDSALHGSNFWTGAYHAIMVKDKYSEHDEATTLDLTTAMFQITGLAGIAATGSFAMHHMCIFWPELSDQQSSQYVQDKLVMYVVAAVVSIIVAEPVIALLDHVSDTILFCKVAESQRGRIGEAASALSPDDEFDDFPVLDGFCCSSGTRKSQRLKATSNGGPLTTQRPNSRQAAQLMSGADSSTFSDGRLL